jgi:hypothetical protein
MLGLVDKRVPKRIEHCAQGHELPRHGVCRRSQQCRADAEKAGAIA